jgi:hypothetical protein
MAAFDSLVVTDAVHNLLPDAFDASLFLGHRRREFGHCTVSLPGYRGRCNVTARLTAAGGTTGMP